MMLPPGVLLAAWIAERSVTTPGAGFKMSAKLLTLKTAGAKRSSKHSNAGRPKRRRSATGFPFKKLRKRCVKLRTKHLLWWTRPAEAGRFPIRDLAFPSNDREPHLRSALGE